MSAATQGSEEGSVEAETSNGSTSTSSTELVAVTEKLTEVAPGSTSDATEDNLLSHSDSDGNEGEVQSDSSNATMVPDTFSDDDSEFNPELPTRMELSNQTTPAKDVVIKKENAATNNWKSEKKVLATPTTQSTESVMVAKPHVITEKLVIERQNVEVETEIRLQEEEFMKDLCQITLMTKSQFKYSDHFKSGRYYLPEAPMLSSMGMSSGLLLNLTSMARLQPLWCNLSILLFRGAND